MARTRSTRSHAGRGSASSDGGSLGRVDVECAPIEIATEFKDFDDFWRPFTHGTGPAPGFCTSLDPTAQLKLADLLRSRLPYQPDGTIALTARAWAVKARNA